MTQVTQEGNLVQTTRLLVVSRDSAIWRQLWSVAKFHFWQIDPVATALDAIDGLQAGATPRMLLLDMPRGDAESLQILRWLNRLRPELPVLVMCCAEDASREAEAMRLGAAEVLIRPFSEGKLEAAISRQLTPRFAGENETRTEGVEQLGPESFFISAGPVTQKLRAQAQLLAEADVPVLILGEVGSGKDTLARLIHKLSVRSGFKFFKVNCADTPAELLEGELFGNAGGSSYAANRIGAGKFERAEGGTVFLSEIAEMPLHLQAKLMHVLQDKIVIQPGTEKPASVDVRVLACSSANLERALAEGKLREDLYRRLNAFTVQVPPLRQRKSEIPVLLPHLMHRISRHYGMAPREFSAVTVDACQQYSWPGNLTELASFVKRYLVGGEREPVASQLSLVDVEERSPAIPARELVIVHGQAKEEGSEERSGSKSLKSLVQSLKSDAERSAIETALQKTGWNRKAAARLLQVSYRTLLYKIDRYRLSATGSVFSPVSVQAKALRSNGKG